MSTGIDTVGASSWLQARRRVQELAEVALGDASDYFLYRGRLYGEGAPGRFVATLLGSMEGCEVVARLIERLDAGGAVEAVVVDNDGREPEGPGRPVLRLVVGHLCQVWSNGKRETV
ncbi:MAG: hypothetical protein IH606_07280 [Burkholderiales bacterium]|nr:hypothetical protein [Burkholderiales bacterium]